MLRTLDKTFGLPTVPVPAIQVIRPWEIQWSKPMQAVSCLLWQITHVCDPSGELHKRELALLCSAREMSLNVVEASAARSQIKLKERSIRPYYSLDC